MESQKARKKKDSFQQQYDIDAAAGKQIQNTPEKYKDIYIERELKTHTDRES